MSLRNRGRFWAMWAGGDTRTCVQQGAVMCVVTVNASVVGPGPWRGGYCRGWVRACCSGTAPKCGRVPVSAAAPRVCVWIQ